MAEEKLRKAFSLMKQGQNKEAIAIVQNILKEDKNYVPAWWLMTNLLADDPERQKKALERVLSLEPKHKQALELKAKLEGKTAPKAGPRPAQAAQQQQNNMKSTEEINLDWSKLEAKGRGQEKQVDEASSANTVKVVTYGMIVFVLIVVGVLAAMWAIPAYQFSLINNPEDTILRFYNQFFQGNTGEARKLVCASEQPDFDTLAPLAATAVNELKAQFGEGAVVTFDFSGLTAEEVTNDGTTATVRVSGEYTLSSGGVTELQTVQTTDENLEELHFENGVWCIAKVQ
jgi:hypothetical protein